MSIRKRKKKKTYQQHNNFFTGPSPANAAVTVTQLLGNVVITCHVHLCQRHLRLICFAYAPQTQLLVFVLLWAALKDRLQLTLIFNQSADYLTNKSLKTFF